ncbi:hypothetical protein [Nonomuraea maritima]
MTTAGATARDTLRRYGLATACDTPRRYDLATARGNARTLA